ncbi:hypothetical protein AOCH_004535 [Aspergillus ochraceoroseus]|uniref:Dicer-like protein 2 n=1 Tax=Aspergillus ochraceoroseus TaxID=138278 RepID=A0A0F8UES8_9EURO|nr:hypothetical protein AOCH_004535 [Aspergillus ochraceoroseus]
MASTIPTGDTDVPAYRPRNYQREMFEASLKGNIIVAMDTGSGKTHMYAFPLLAFLVHIASTARAPSTYLIWFLAPTVALCIQQHEVISKHIPAARSRTLTGLDKVELWTEQPVWDAVLKDIQVVISTHAVLADAMTHGFIKVSQLGLIIFDEAHHCMRKHPANKIMRDFYHPAMAKYGPDAVPRIMGLTASPVVRSSRHELLTIESNLASKCVTPRVHRHELLEHTHRPELQRILFSPVTTEDVVHGSETLRALIRSWQMLDIEKDPYVKRLRESSVDGKALQKVLSTGKTYCGEQLKRLADRARHIFEELGEWAADYFIWESIEQLRAKTHDKSVMMDWDDEEKQYLIEILSQLPVPGIDLHSSDPDDFPISPKFAALISFLSNINENEFSGLIFAQQRATVGVMAQLLSVHPSTRDRFRTAGYVGWSSGSSRKDALGELLTMKMQRDTLDDFRGGRKNLIVATDVLEEGIDVSACSMVVCYNKPPNLKSFVQRRGRARRQQSTYAILVSTDEDSLDLHKWQDLEKAMVEAYQDDQRILQELWALEETDEEVCERFLVESTGAVLTSDNATQHLYHFCSVLPVQPYGDNRPEFSFESNDNGLLKGKVTLPSCVHPTVRCTEGKTWFLTERAARKDAAFQSYKSLYESGLVNDHLLPLTKSREFTQKDLCNLPSMVEVAQQYDPWVDWAYSWSSPHIHQSRIVVRQNGVKDNAYMRLICPTIPPLIGPMTLFWDSETTFSLEFETPERIPSMSAESLENMRVITALYLQATTTKRLGTETDFITLFSPDVPQPELVTWLDRNNGCEAALDVYSSARSRDLMGIVRDRSRYDELLLFRSWIVSDANSSSGLELECDSFPKRRNLLQQQTLAVKRSEVSDDKVPEPPTKKRIISADRCTIDKLPTTETIFGRFISVIVDRLEVALVAAKLCETTLQGIGFSDFQHVVTAITTPSCQAPTNYQRYEFFGDSVLKFTVSYSLFYHHPNWHEGYLSEGRDGIVQNPRLARAALDRGLDAFVISRMFTPRKWSAPLISDKLSSTSTPRTMSTKVLADVVEALIGAAYIDGGHAKAQACISRFLPEVQIYKLDTPVVQDPPPELQAQPHLHHIQHKTLEANLGYTFTNKLLLVEALTHPSCQSESSTQSYQRLEFLGDAVLDMAIVSTLLAHKTEIPQGDMTRIKHAVVNANLLAFLCMEYAWTEVTSDVSVCSTTGEINLTSKENSLHLWHFLRCDGSMDLKNARERAVARHSLLRTEILARMAHGDQYPWLLLSQLNPDKFFSDIIESVLGALFVDSAGDLAVCENFLERIGLLTYLRRILTGDVSVVHPRNVAQQVAKDNLRFVVKRIQDEIAIGGSADNGTVHVHSQGQGQRLGATYQATVEMGQLGLPDIFVEGCLSSEEAEIQAASAAVEVLRARAVSSV